MFESISTHFEWQLYRNCTNQIVDTLRENELWEDLYTLYTTAVSIEPYEEWQLGQLDALDRIGAIRKSLSGI